MIIFIYLILLPLLTALFLILNYLFSISRPYFEKMSSYECGFSEINQTRNPFSISFYLVCLLFLILDLEIALVFPAAISLAVISTYGFYVIVFFILILTIGFIYEYCSGAIKWSSYRSTPINS